MSINVTQLSEQDREDWQRLYHGYAEFYQMPMGQQILDTLWGWILDPDNAFFALIARDEQGKALGFMHCRAMPSPLRGAMVGFLDDLFVLPAARGQGVVDTLYTALAQLAKQQGWPFVRWITAEDNYRGRAVYDRLADKTHWVTYQMKVE